MNFSLWNNLACYQRGALSVRWQPVAMWIFAPPVTQKSRLSGLLAAKSASEFAG
jgi:hypothetical protein